MLHRLVTEFVGTFFLVLVIATAAVFGYAGDGAPLAVAAVLMATIYAGGHVSRAHYNPAVSVAFLLHGQGFGPRDFAGYLGVQVLATCAASSVAVAFFPPPEPVETATLQVLPALAGEFFFTFLLVWTILHVALARGQQGNPFYGVAIAMAVMAGIYSVGTISLALFNPAVALSFVLLGKMSLAQLWIPLAGTPVAAAAAFAVFRIGEK